MTVELRRTQKWEGRIFCRQGMRNELYFGKRKILLAGTECEGMKWAQRINKVFLVGAVCLLVTACGIENAEKTADCFTL